MCLIAFAIGAHADLPLLIAANRDEFFERPTAALNRWRLSDNTAVIAGRDLREGGTWLGMNESGRVAMLTNVRSADLGPGRRSRGELPARWLQPDTDWLNLKSQTVPGDYGGFNLVVGDIRQGFWAWISNRDPAHPHLPVGAERARLHSQRLLPGVYGLSNAALDTPWPKTLALKTAVRSALTAPTAEQRQGILTRALANPDRSPTDQLPCTGVPPHIERALSSPFVDMRERGYGTRSSLILSVAHESDRDAWTADLLEWTHAPGAGKVHRWTAAAPVVHTLKL